MNSDNQPQFENDLAQAAEPEEIENTEPAEATHDPAESLQIGLVKLYYNYSQEIENQLKSGLISGEKANELTAQVDGLSLADLGQEISKGLPLEIAKEIMEPNMFFGPDEVRKSGIEIREEIPAIPFNPEELERAKELGQMLIYRTSTTMKELDETIGPILKEQDMGICITDNNWYKDQDIYTSEKIQPGWALVSKELNSGSTNRNYLEQSEFLAEYLVYIVFKGKTLPQKYQEAIDQLNAQKETIRPSAVSSNGDEWNKASDMLVNLKINQLFRQSPTEVIYDFIVYFQNTGERLHESDYVWTSSLDARHKPFSVGRFILEGAIVYSESPSFTYGEQGASFCRRGADLKS